MAVNAVAEDIDMCFKKLIAIGLAAVFMMTPVAVPAAEEVEQVMDSEGAQEEQGEPGEAPAAASDEEPTEKEEVSQPREVAAPVYDEADLKKNTEKADSYNAIIYGNEDWDDVGPAVDDKYG